MKHKAVFICFVLFSVSRFSLSGYAYQKGQDLNMAPPEAIGAMVKQAVELAERDRPEESVAILRKAIAMAPNYLKAHAEYIRVQTYLLERYDDVRAEYESLMAREPNNPIYPMALAVGQPLTTGQKLMSWFRKAAEIAPDWTWGQYAKAILLSDKEPERAVSELLKCIERMPTEIQPYYMLMEIQADKLGKADEALKTAQKMIAQPEVRPFGLVAFWQWQLVQAQGSSEARTRIKGEMDKLATGSQDIEILKAIYRAYSYVLQDPESAKFFVNRIKRINPDWYPGQGSCSYRATSNFSGIPRQVVAANHQLEINDRISEISEKNDPKENMKTLEHLLDSNPNRGMKWYIYKNLFIVAEKAGDEAAMIKYGEALSAMDRADYGLLAKMALGLANRKTHLDLALRYAGLAEKETARFKAPQRPANTDEDWFKYCLPEDYQKTNYQKLRALTLQALGWVYYQKGDLVEAEARLRQSVGIERSEERLSELAEVLRHLGRTEEAQRYLTKVETELSEAVKKKFINEPGKDFELEGIDNQKYRLSNLKGKVVILNFWATWCGPCAREMPHLVKIFERYRGRGLIILAISVDKKSDRYKVAQFADEHKLSFPILYGEGIEATYKVEGYPTNIFIDRLGNIRYKQFGFDEQTVRIFEIVINELIQ
jgi:thiol-disulfide isomerase/thioredoxin